MLSDTAQKDGRWWLTSPASVTGTEYLTHTLPLRGLRVLAKSSEANPGCSCRGIKAHGEEVCCVGRGPGRGQVAATLAVSRDSLSVLGREGAWYPKGGQSVGGMGSSPCSPWEEKAYRAWELR